MTEPLSHVGPEGKARMVDVSAKPVTLRTARAAGQIRMARTRFHQRRGFIEAAVLVEYLDRHRRTDGAAAAHAGQKLDRIGFQPLAGAAAIAALPPPQFAVDEIEIQRHARR